MRRIKLKYAAPENYINSTLTLNLRSFVVFFLSLFTSASLLIVERAVGIGWDFHPDSITYATTSEYAFHSIRENWFQLFNNAYYVIAYFLGQDVVIITGMNMVVFSLTNVFIYRIVKKKSFYHIDDMLILLILLNPYRIHLSTTLLKDTLIIFFMITLLNKNLISRTLSFFCIFALRIASPVYLITLISRKHLFLCLLAGATLMLLYFDVAINRILEFNEQDMQLRSFDKIPTFQQFGVLGALLRGVVWSLLAFSGFFFLLNPAPAFFPVAIGSLMTLIFLKIATGSYRIPVQLLVAASIFGVMVTGYTAYIRYIYPILVVWPLIAITRND